MIVVKLSNGKNVTEKLPKILDDAISRKEHHIVLMTEKEWHEEVCLVVKNHKKIAKVIVAGKPLYCIKGMRIEIETIEYTI